MIPILLNHDASRVIGSMRETDGRLLVEFAADVRVTREMFFEIFGNPGACILDFEEKDGLVTIRKAEILEVSFSPTSGRASSHSGE